jgi:PST family polysaccharide transporter
VSEARLEAKVNRGVAWSAAAQAVIAIADLVSQVLVLRWFIDDAVYGVIAAGITFYTLLDSAADLGVTSALIQRDDHTPERVSTVFWFNVLLSAGLFAVLLVLGPLYGRFEGNAVIGWLLVAYGGKLIFQNVYAIPFALMRKEMRFADIASSRMLAHLSESIGRLVFAWAGAGVWCFTLAALTRTVVFGVIMQLRHPFLPRFVFKPREVVDYVRFGLRSGASQILYQLYTNLDYAVVFYFFGKAANGIYALAYFVVLEPVKTIANVVIDIAFPTFARLRADREALVAQFIRFTRLNLIAVLPFVMIIVLVVPELLRVFYAGKQHTLGELALCGEAARILCAVGVLRALGFLGPPLLDGIGRPEATLRYMVIATVAVPGCFVLGAWLLGPQLGLLSVAIAWAVGYPIAFAVLSYMVARSIELPLRAYLRGAWGIVGCMLAGTAAGLAVSYAIPDASDGARLAAISATSLVVALGLLVTWQGITPRSIRASMRD